MTQLTGHCLCAKHGFTLHAAPFMQVICHCDSCRRAAGAALVGFVGVKNGEWDWQGTPPKSYESSPGVQRYFCSNCGSSLGFIGATYPGQFYANAATLSDPTLFKPTAHVHHDEILTWATPNDTLPRHLATTELL